MFWAPYGSGEGQVGGGCLEASGGMEGVTTCMHMHAHTHKCMYRNCKWPLTWRHPCLSCLSCLTCMCMCVCVCVYMHMHVCVHDTPPTHPYPTPPQSTHPPLPQGDPENWSKFNNTWTNQDISILFEDLKSVENSPPMGGCMTQSRQFNSVWRFIICRDTPTHGWVCGWLGVSVGQWVQSGQMTKNLINLDLIEIIQFNIQIYDL